MKRFICSLIALVCVFSFVCFTGSGSTAKADKVELPSLPAINAAEQLYQSLLQAVQGQNAQHTITISNASYPKPGSTHKKGQKFELKGLISSTDKITNVCGFVGVPNSDVMVLGPVDIYPNSKSVQIYTSRINTGLKFGKLPKGTFTLIIKAETNYTEKVLVNSTFHVK